MRSGGTLQNSPGHVRVWVRGHLRKHNTACTCDCSLESRYFTCSKWPPQLGVQEHLSHLGDQKTVKWLCCGHLTFSEPRTRRGNTFSKFYDHWLLWTVTIIMVSHEALRKRKEKKKVSKYRRAFKGPLHNVELNIWTQHLHKLHCFISNWHIQDQEATLYNNLLETQYRFHGTWWRMRTRSSHHKEH